MKALDIKVSIKIIDSNSEKNEKRRITMKDMSKMSLSDIEKNMNNVKESFDKGETDEYTTNTLTTLCGKAIEELDKSFDKEDEKKLKKYEKMMEDFIKMEKADEFDECEKQNKNNEIDVNKNLNNENKEKNEINIIEENKIEINNIDNTRIKCNEKTKINTRK